MKQWILKNSSGIFDYDLSQPDGFLVIDSIENSFYIAECPVEPNGDFVVEFPPEYCNNLEYHIFPNKKRVLGLTNKEINLSDDVDKKRRRAIIYTEDQMNFRISLIKWLALNIWIPDKKRMKNLDDSVVQQMISDITVLNDDMLLKKYISNNLYYDL
jgi:hypothetical protein